MTGQNMPSQDGYGNGDIITRDFNGQQIGQRGDGYLNATAMCKANAKDFFDYERLETTKAFIAELERSPGIPGDLVLKTTKGPNAGRGTWVHPHIGYHLAQWCSAAFAVQVSQWIDDIRTQGFAAIAQGEDHPLDAKTVGGVFKGVLAKQLAPLLGRIEALERMIGHELDDMLMSIRVVEGVDWSMVDAPALVALLSDRGDYAIAAGRAH